MFFNVHKQKPVDKPTPQITNNAFGNMILHFMVDCCTAHNSLN